MTSGLRILSPGLQSLVQDLGRHGHSGLGVSAAGALDRASLRRANRLVGNAPSAAVIETVAGGLKVRAVGDQVLAVAGAPSELGIESAPDSAGDTRHRTVPVATPFALLDGETLSLGAPHSGFRSYLAVRGGVDAAPVLGSRSTDTMSGIGPAPLAAGIILAAGGEAESGVVGHPELQPDYPGTGVTVLDVVPGPRADWFDQAALDAFTGQDWSVLPQSNRVGMRLDGTPLQRTRRGELPSEGTVAGALQVPPEGLPGTLPGRPPDHRRLPGHRRGGRLPAGPRRAGAHRRQDPLPLGRLRTRLGARQPRTRQPRKRRQRTRRHRRRSE